MTTYDRLKKENIDLKCERDVLKKRLQDGFEDLSKLLAGFCIILESAVIAYLLYLFIS
jgi:hypothetical protein